MTRRTTIQKELVLNAVNHLHNHATADEVYEFIHATHSHISKGTVYRNLNCLVGEGKLTTFTFVAVNATGSLMSIWKKSLI